MIEQIQMATFLAVLEKYKIMLDASKIEVFRPKNEEHGDWSSNIAFMLAKKFKRPPMEIAEELTPVIDKYIGCDWKEELRRLTIEQLNGWATKTLETKA